VGMITLSKGAAKEEMLFSMSKRALQVPSDMMYLRNGVHRSTKSICSWMNFSVFAAMDDVNWVRLFSSSCFLNAREGIA